MGHSGCGDASNSAFFAACGGRQVIGAPGTTGRGPRRDRQLAQFQRWKESELLHFHWKIGFPLPLAVPSASRQVPAP